MGPFRRLRFCWADSTGCSTIANAVFRLTHPRAFTVRKRTVASTLSTGLLELRWRHPDLLQVAVFAMAPKLAVLVYRMLR